MGGPTTRILRDWLLLAITGVHRQTGVKLTEVSNHPRGAEALLVWIVTEITISVAPLLGTTMRLGMYAHERHIKKSSIPNFTPEPSPEEFTGMFCPDS